MMNTILAEKLQNRIGERMSANKILEGPWWDVVAVASRNNAVLWNYGDRMLIGCLEWSLLEILLADHILKDLGQKNEIMIPKMEIIVIAPEFSVSTM